MKRLIIMLCFAPSLWSQTTFQEQAERLINIQSFLFDFRPAAGPRYSPEVQYELVLDLYPQPDLDTQIGNKDEPIDPPSWVPKLRARRVHRGFMVGLAFAPGIEFEGYKTEFLSAEAGFRKERNNWTRGIRISYTRGTIEGPVTDPDTDDEMDLQNWGLDFSLGKEIGNFNFYGFLGWNALDSVLDVSLDGAQLSSDEGTYYGGLGCGYTWNRWHLNLEQNATDDYLRNMTLSLTRRF